MAQLALGNLHLVTSAYNRWLTNPKTADALLDPRKIKLRAARLRRIKRQIQLARPRSRAWLKMIGLRLVLPTSVLGLALWQLGQSRPRQATLPTPPPISPAPNLSVSPISSPLASPVASPIASPNRTVLATPTSAALTSPHPTAINPTTPAPGKVRLRGIGFPAPPVPQQTPIAVAPTKGPSPEIRVAIAQGMTSFPTGTSTRGVIRSDDGQILGPLTANVAVQVQANPEGGLLVGETPTPTSVWIQASGKGHVFLDGRWYRGRLRLVAAEDGLLAVNYVDLEHYVTSVVGAEVYPSWPIAALKAQAIAARSYAVAHAMRPANRYFDLGNTQRWQVYQGIEDEWNTTAQATGLTRGVVLSHQGTVMVSMYAATDEIIQEAFGGQGMSQTGAYELATRGYNYLQILGAYYPGAGLAQLRVK